MPDGLALAVTAEFETRHDHAPETTREHLTFAKQMMDDFASAAATCGPARRLSTAYVSEEEMTETLGCKFASSGR